MNSRQRKAGNVQPKYGLITPQTMPQPTQPSSMLPTTASSKRRRTSRNRLPLVPIFSLIILFHIFLYMTMYHKEKGSFDDKSNGDLVTNVGDRNFGAVDKVNDGMDKNSIQIKNEVKLKDKLSIHTEEKLGNDSLILNDKQRKEGHSLSHSRSEIRSVHKEPKDVISLTSRPVIAYGTFEFTNLVVSNSISLIHV